VNILLGNIDKKGGWGPSGGKFDPTKPANANTFSQTGIYLDRHKQTPSVIPKRQWYPVASHGICQEIIPSMIDGYPYRTMAMMTYYQDYAYTYPYNQVVPELYHKMDPGAPTTYWLPLIVSIDAFMSETSAMSDYILPDTTYLERWSTYHSHPTIKIKDTMLRQPVVGDLTPVTIETRSTYMYTSYLSSLTGTSFTDVDALLTGFKGPMILDDILINLAKKLGMVGGVNPGENFGTDGITSGTHLDTAWDYMNAWMTNTKAGTDFGNGIPTKLVKDMDATEYEALKTSHRYIYMGGEFENPDDAHKYNGDYVKHPYGNLLSQIFAEPLVSIPNPLDPTGEPYFDPLPNYEGLKDLSGADIDDMSSGYNFTLISHKPVQHTQSRTAQNPWLMMLRPENAAEMNKTDADALGIEDGDMIRISSPTFKEGMLIKVKVSNHIRKGVIDVPWGWGHWEFGSKTYHVDNAAFYDSGDGMTTNPDTKTREANPKLGKGYNVNSLMRGDPFYLNASSPSLTPCVTTDRIGGGANQYLHFVKVRRG
jgi:anaerobic selenocysteine-containing dehydrogenase